MRSSHRTDPSAPAYADRLARMDLGASHIGHIPSHIYYRVGRYKDSLAVNKKAARQTRPISRSEAEVIAALSRDTDWSALVTGGCEPDQRRKFARSYAPGSPARQPICQNSISRQVASLKMAQSSTSRAGVT